MIQRAVLSLLLSDLGRDALRVCAGLAVAVAIAIALGVAAVTGLVLAAAGVRPTPASPAAGPTAVALAAPPGAPVPEAVAVARRVAGTPYVWGGASPTTGFDCSGLVQWTYGQVGVRLPRTAQQQYDATRRVPTADLQPGDLVFFQICCQPPDTVTHVGIYVGGGQMVHAPTEGQVVRVESIDTPFWRGHFAGAGRPPQPRGGDR